MRARAATALLLGALCAVLLFAWPVAAKADGDPASDILYSESVFVPIDAGLPSTLQLQLTALVSEADRRGFQLKVALIATSADLGSDTPLWPHPVLYSRFLGTELSLAYHGRLLIAMPDGLAIYRLGHAVGPEERLIEQIAPAPGGRGLLASALTAIQRLAAAAGHPLTLPRESVAREVQRPTSIWPLIVSLLGALVIVAAWVASLRMAPPTVWGRARRWFGVSDA